MELDDMEIGVVRCKKVDDDMYLNADDLVIAIQYENNELYNKYKDMPNFNEEYAEIINGATDMICDAISNIAAQSLKEANEQELDQ